MKKILVLTIILLSAVFQTMAQVDYSFGHVAKKRDFKHVPTVGIKGGLGFYNMHFSIKEYNKLPGNNVMNPGFGLFVEYDLNISKLQGLAIGGEIMSIGRGYKKDFTFRGKIREIDQMESKYIDLRIPVSYYFMNYSTVSPYIFVAPDFAYCYGGTWSKTFPDGEVNDISVNISDSDAVISPFDISLNMGVGVRFKIKHPVFTVIVKLDGSYNLGLMNVKSKENGKPSDVYAYSFYNEIRNNRGFEFMLSIGMPLKLNLKHDACWGWR